MYKHPQKVTIHYKEIIQGSVKSKSVLYATKSALLFLIFAK